MISRQNGQAMAEYVVVCAALITALFLGANTECDGNKCISKLLTVMHDSYAGYSSSISAVQKYGDFTAKGDFTDGYGSNTVTRTDSGSGTVGGLNPDGLTEVNSISSIDGMTTYGNLLADGTVVDPNGNEIGFYSNSNNILTMNDGSANSVTNNRVIVDEQGNVIYVRAVTDCTPPPIPPPQPAPARFVYSWVYESKATDKVFKSVDVRAEIDIGDLCTEPSFKIVKNGQEQSGRILNSQYYAVHFAGQVSSIPLLSDGVVIYWDELGTCSVMENGWDDNVNLDGDDAQIYEEKLRLFRGEKNLGQMDSADYIQQTIASGIPRHANNCPTVNVISQP